VIQKPIKKYKTNKGPWLLFILNINIHPIYHHYMNQMLLNQLILKSKKSHCEESLSEESVTSRVIIRRVIIRRLPEEVFLLVKVV
jgi:hypothetical protein